MTFRQFRENARLVEQARTLLADPVAKLMLEALRDNPPLRRMRSLTPQEVNPESASYLLGIGLGYTDALDSLSSLGQPWPVTEEPEARFEEA